MKYFALIADIVKSRNQQKRNELQKSLSSALDEINTRQNLLLSPYTITIGDEFQAVYTKPDGIIRDILTIILIIHPTNIRFSIGYGEITTEINNQSSVGMDGPAFYYARDQMDSLKKTKSTTIRFAEKEEQRLDLINNSLKVLTGEIAKWKFNTLFIFNKLLEGYTVSMLTTEMDISERGIYKIIQSNQVNNFVALLRSLEKELKARY